MTYTSARTLTFEEFLAQYGDDPCYELIDGVLRDMEPTGPHESVAGKLAGRIFCGNSASEGAVDDSKKLPDSALAAEATALRPDVVVLDEIELAAEPLWEREPILAGGRAIALAIEVVSTNWQDDYARKVEEYALLGT